MQGKKVIAILITVILLLLSLTSSLSALDTSVAADAEVAMNPLQMSVFKLSARRKGMDTYETARAVLRQVGYPESIIEVMPEDKLLSVADSRRIETKEEYVCISPDGESTVSSKAQYEMEQNTSEGISELASTSSTPTENSWAKLQTWVMQSNSDRTSYAYSATCTWLTTPFWRMNDYIAVGVTQGAVDPNSTLSVFTYTRTDFANETSTDAYETKSGQNEITILGTTANTFFNLPNDAVAGNSDGTVSGVTFRNFVMMIWMNGIMTDASFTVPMNVFSAYFHQKIVVNKDITVSISGSGVGISFSISPEGRFNAIRNSLIYTHSI